MQKLFCKKENTGFTLLETLVAVTVLVVATVGPLTLAANSIHNAALFRNQTIAYFLAEEAAEYIRNQIDANSFEGNDWLNNLGTCMNANGCEVDVPDDNISGCGSACRELDFEEDTGLYGYGGGGSWQDTNFRRIVNITVVDTDSGGDPREIRIDSRVEWPQRGSTRDAGVSVHVFDWR